MTYANFSALASITALTLVIGALGSVSGALRAAGTPTPTSASVRLQLAEYRRPTAAPYPEENRFTAERERLGRTLFFDPRLSRSSWIACASCHNPGLAWGDGLPRALGHGMQQLGRRTPTLLNLAWSPELFWDGRAESLEAQALGPIEAPGEMNLPLADMVARLRAIPGYAAMFAAAYPGEGITPEVVGKAIATFERGIVSAQAPFDRWVAGDASAMSEEARRGFAVFTGKGACQQCHSGWRFTDDSFHDIGVPGEDLGRATVLPMIDLARYAFKTPTLRNVALRAPYLHDGSAATLADVIELYDRGGIVRRESLSQQIKPLHLTASEKSDLVAFMMSLTSRDPEVRVPALPR